MDKLITSAQTANWAFQMAKRETYRVVNVYDAQALIDKDQEDRKVFLISLRSVPGCIDAIEVDLNDSARIHALF